MKTAQIWAGVLLAGGVVYSLYKGNTALVIFFTSLFVVAVLAPGLISRTSEFSLGSLRASFREKIDRADNLTDEQKGVLKARVEKAASLGEALDAVISFTGEMKDKGE